MEEEPVQAIRGLRRNQLVLERKKLKNEETDVRRSLGKLRISQSDVMAIANKLKTKSTISAAELKVLQNAIVDDINNIEVVLNTHGALRGLVRELTGHDASKQCAACGCLCNLALGDSRACCIIAKAAGAYLMTCLESLSTQLATSCAWSLGNLAGGARKSCELLLPLAASKLCDVSARDDVTDAALYALVHIAYVMKHDLNPGLLNKMIQSLSNIEITVNSSKLLFILSCHKDFTQESITETFLQKIIEKLTVSLKNHLDICKRTFDLSTIKSSEKMTEKSKCCELFYLLRTIANMNSEELYKNLLSYFIENGLVGTFSSLLKSNSDGSVWWFLGNLLNACGENVFFHQLITDF